jgi:hypothetical protein
MGVVVYCMDAALDMSFYVMYTPQTKTMYGRRLVLTVDLNVD